MSDRMKYILSYADDLDLAILRKIKMSIHQLGLNDTLIYLTQKSKPERLNVYAYIDNYLKDESHLNMYINNIMAPKGKSPSNKVQALAELEIKRLIVDTILVLESGVKLPVKTHLSHDRRSKFYENKYNDGGKKGSQREKNKDENNKDQYGVGQEKEDEGQKGAGQGNEYITIQSYLDEIVQAKGYTRINLGTVKSRPNSRMAVGVSEASSNELGLHLNFLTGFPELSASAIKGVFRHYCEECEKVMAGKLEDWFGTEEKEGRLLFLNAVPESFSYEDDIITNHYGDYYNNVKKYPVQQKPTIINYKAVIINKMEIQMFLKDCKDNSTNKESEEIQELFENCIQSCNFGAKGAVGYGYLEFDGEGKKND